MKSDVIQYLLRENPLAYKLIRFLDIRSVNILSLVSKSFQQVYSPTFAPWTLDELEGFIKNPHCSYVRRIDLTRVVEDIPEKLLNNLFQKRFENLEHINLSGCYDVTNDVVNNISISSNSEKLQSICLFGCYQVTDDSVKKLVSNNPDLAHLILDGCDRLTDAAFLNLPGNALQKLTHLSVSSCNQLSDASILAIAEKTTVNGKSSLFNLDVSGCRQLTDNIVVKLLEPQFHLGAINGAGCDGFGLAFSVISIAYNGRPVREYIDVTLPSNPNDTTGKYLESHLTSMVEPKKRIGHDYFRDAFRFEDGKLKTNSTNIAALIPLRLSRPQAIPQAIAATYSMGGNADNTQAQPVGPFSQKESDKNNGRKMSSACCVIS